MSDRRRGVSTRAMLANPQREVLTAATQPLDYFNTQTLVVQPTEWQREAWNYYHSLGELNFAVDSWQSNAVSRCRLFLGQRVPGTDEPTPVLDGPLAEIVATMAGGIDGQTAMLKRMAVHMSIPGDSYLVTEDDPATGVRGSTVYSSSEIRITSRGGPDTPLRYQVQTQRALWRELSKEALVSRVWWPDAEYGWRASSPAEAALPIMREIDMYNRYIVAILLSRVASNGMLLIPDEVTFPVKSEYKDASDPFVAEWIDIASRAVKNPGSAAAALPMPIRVPAAMIEKFRHLTMHTDMGEKVLEDRDRALKRLATALNMPPEAMSGMGDVNHWGQWQISEDSVKIHLSPILEVIVHGLTASYLKPMAVAAGVPTSLPDGSEYVIWYDPSALVQQPDRTEEAQALYDRGELSGTALRRDTGFEEADKPTTAELKQQALLKIVMAGGPDAMAALAVLVNDPSLAPAPPPAPVVQAPAPAAPATPAPADQPAPPPPPADTGPAATAPAEA